MLKPLLKKWTFWSALMGFGFLLGALSGLLVAQIV